MQGMMTLRELKKIINNIPEEYEDCNVCIKTSSRYEIGRILVETEYSVGIGTDTQIVIKAG